VAVGTIGTVVEEEVAVVVIVSLGVSEIFFDVTRALTGPVDALLRVSQNSLVDCLDVMRSFLFVTLDTLVGLFLR
jgi:uncharacterized membrane protein